MGCLAGLLLDNKTISAEKEKKIEVVWGFSAVVLVLIGSSLHSTHLS